MDTADAMTATARSRTYGLLALAFDYPDGAVLAALREQAQQLEDDLQALGERENLAYVAAVRAALETLTAGALRAHHARCFGHGISKDCPPYETEYAEAHIFQKSQALADIAGFYRAFGLELAPEFRDRVDHVSAELEFMQFLCAKEAYGLAAGHPPEQVALCRKAQGAFLREHLGRWVHGFTRRLQDGTADGVYAQVSALLAAFVARELRALGAEATSDASPPWEEDGAPCRTAVLVAPPTLSRRGGRP